MFNLFWWGGGFFAASSLHQEPFPHRIGSHCPGKTFFWFYSASNTLYEQCVIPVIYEMAFMGSNIKTTLSLQAFCPTYEYRIQSFKAQPAKNPVLHFVYFLSRDTHYGPLVPPKMIHPQHLVPYTVL